MSQRFHSLRQNPKIPNYRNDGAGRDTYISFYNGGFGRYKLSDTYFKEKNDSPKHIYHQDLALCKPTKRYFTDGGGRDLYVYNPAEANFRKNYEKFQFLTNCFPLGTSSFGHLKGTIVF